MFVQQILNELQDLKEKVSLSLQEIEELDAACKSILQIYLSDSTNKQTTFKIQTVIDYMYEKINIGDWKQVKHFIRKTITIATYLKLLAYISTCNDISKNVIKESYKIIDFGIIFGCPLDKEPELLQHCASILNLYSLEESNNTKLDMPIVKQNSSTDTMNANKYDAIVIDKIDCPSMEYFYKFHILTQQPVILDNCISHWSALDKWKDQNYFIQQAGCRTVSIEIGSKYTDTDWTQKLMTLEEFITQHIYQQAGPTGYLAQYQLFDQIPELKNDILVPEYCSFSENDEPVDVMAWYGPKGTVSPLHHDPKRNLLAQVVGEKQIFLFAPTDSEYLYPHDHDLLNNTAQVDPRHPDFEKYPKYKHVKAYYCLLKPGQMLFIPPKWWHFVESLSVSFSVSFWWE